MSFRLTREQLYDLVWSEPMKRLSEKIGISDVAIAKHCRKLGVPVPPRGYWNKLQAGHNADKTDLPPRDLSTINSVEMSGSLGSGLRANIKGEPGDDDADESIEVLAERFRKRLGNVSIPSGFTQAHPVIAKLLAKDDELRRKYVGEPYIWNQPRFDSPFERRRLQILNGLFLGFAKVGGSPWIRGDDVREIHVYTGDSSISLELDAVGRKTTSRDSKSLKPGTKLRLTVDSRTQLPAGVRTMWEDSDGNPLEKQITETIVGLAVAGQHLHRILLRQQAIWRQQLQEQNERRERERVEEAERKERERLAAIEQAKLDALLQDVRAWQNANTIRIYVTRVQSSCPSEAADAERETWARWALAEADRMDPLSSGRAFKFEKPHERG